jgi:hypothetical protein
VGWASSRAAGVLGARVAIGLFLALPWLLLWLVLLWLVFGHLAQRLPWLHQWLCLFGLLLAVWGLCHGVPS